MFYLVGKFFNIKSKFSVNAVNQCTEEKVFSGSDVKQELNLNFNVSVRGHMYIDQIMLKYIIKYQLNE